MQLTIISIIMDEDLVEVLSIRPIKILDFSKGLFCILKLYLNHEEKELKETIQNNALATLTKDQKTSLLADICLKTQTQTLGELDKKITTTKNLVRTLLEEDGTNIDIKCGKGKITVTVDDLNEAACKILEKRNRKNL